MSKKTGAVVSLSMPKLEKLIDQADPRAEKIVAETAMEVWGSTRVNIRRQGLVDQGNLIGSVQTERKGRLLWWVVVNAHYGRIHEFGGHIVAKKARYLAIPLPGVTGRPRDYDLHVQVNKDTNQAVLADDAGKVFFVLKKSVYIPARPYLRPAANAARARWKERWKELCKV